MKVQNIIIALLIICLVSISACTNSLSENKPAGKCTKEYMPVCGNDGRTYSNKCMAGKTGIAYEGICLVGTHNCSEAEKNNKACTLEYLPVCGNDNKTYGNKCSACATGIDSWKMGECKSEDEHICTPEEMEKIACTMDYNPVCGNDGNTYSNGCVACAAKVTKWKSGECKIN